MKIWWLILVLLALSACSTVSSGFGKYFGGRGGQVGGQGVILNFIDAPEENQEMYENEIFQLGIEIENNVPGERGLIGEICVRDTLTTSYGGIPDRECLSVNLPPATELNGRITPSADIFQFGPYSYYNLEAAYTQPVALFADLKYEVESNAFASTCVKRLRAQSPTIPQNCGKKQDIRVQQPDLPIEISKLTTSSSSTDTQATVRLEIILKKVREGQVVTASNLFTEQQPGLAEISFEVAANQIQANCVGNGRVQFRQNENEKKVICTVNLPLESDYFDVPIRIKMGYGFIQSIQGRNLKLLKGENLA